jgi:ammonia channel protein AmtB
VGVGAVSDMMIHPWGAVLIGIVAGVLSVLGFKYLTVSIEPQKFRHISSIHFSCLISDVDRTFDHLLAYLNIG